MCDERERLIEYVYGEASPDEQRRVEAHLRGCDGCREEVRGLRSVRDDLLAWDVPPHEPVWRPFAPVAVPAVVRPRVSTWALAAAAGAVFTAGLAGGLAARGWLPAAVPEAPVVQTAAAAMVGPQPVAAVTPDDLARLEATILDRVRAEMSAHLAADSAGPSRASGLVAVSASTRHDDTEARLAAIEEWMDDQISLNMLFNGHFGRQNSRISSLADQFELSRLQQVAFDGGEQGR